MAPFLREMLEETVVVPGPSPFASTVVCLPSTSCVGYVALFVNTRLWASPFHWPCKVAISLFLCEDTVPVFPRLGFYADDTGVASLLNGVF